MTMTISRRQFLTRASAAAAAIGFPTVIPSTAFGANERIALGVIGSGDRGMLNARNLMASGDCRIVAVCDARHSRMRGAKDEIDRKYGDKGCAEYADFRDLLARKEIDAVMCAPQDHWHSLVTVAAARAGKDVWCEKPTGVCVSDGIAMRAVIRKYNRVFQSGLWQRSLGNFRQGAELARNGYLGKITEVRVAVESTGFQPKFKGPYQPQPIPADMDWKMWLGPARWNAYNYGRIEYPDFYLVNDYCEGWTTNWGVHHLDIAQWGCPALATEPFEVEVSEASYYVNKGYADNIERWKAVFTYPDGLRMVFTDNEKQPLGTRFIGEKGWVQVNRGDQIEASGDLLRLRPQARDVRLLPADKMAFDDVTTIKAKAGDRVGYKSVNHWQGFLDAIRSRKEAIAGIDATHTASTLGMVAGIAARLQQKLKWDWKTERFVGNDLANTMLTRPMHNGWKLEG